MKEIFFDTIDSTNTYLKQHFEEYEDLTFVSADLQTAGKGRSGRTWTASKGKNLTFSVLIKDEKVMEKFASLSVLSAYSVLKVLKSYGIKDLSIKWPNDVYVRDDKICGILLEAVSREKMEALILGIGINVNEEDFETDLLHEPTSMKKVLHEDIDIVSFKEKIYQRLNQTIEELKEGCDLYPEIEKYDYLKGKDVYCMIRNEKRKVTVIGIDADYSLKVLCDGKEISVSSDEITFHL